jgi:hypothetical protein
MSQATDNITTISTRRALLAGAPATVIAVAAGPVLAAITPDPMLASVEQYKAAVHARAAVLNAESDYEKYKTEREWEEAQRDVLHAEYVAFDEILDTTPTTIAGIVAVLEVLGTDPYNEGSMSAAAWAYNGCGNECPVDRLMLELAALLRNGAAS